MSKPARNPIRVLPRELAEKIAAGEVVERPSSVVKELVENSLDAGATRIRVELEDGGRKRIAVEDDGLGIAAPDLLTALERHATSKISTLDDLWNLHTLGFRGEALPSIAAVSRMTLHARAEGERGRKVYLEAGKLLADETGAVRTWLGGARGTLVQVEDLFYNVPARLKFLKAKATETSFIRELLERLALTHPGVGFTLVSEGRKTLDLSPMADPLRRVADVMESSAENIETLESRFQDIEVRGWLERDKRASNSRGVYLAVNGRMVRDRLLQQAVLMGLRPRMMEGEYPRVYVEVQVPPSDVDVNVHPAKSEVRFRRSKDVFQVVYGALERTAKTPDRPYYSVEAAGAPNPEPLFSDGTVRFRSVDYPLQNTAPQAMDLSRDRLQVPRLDGPGFQGLHYIGQLKNTYLLFQDDDGMVIVDQHAAHERVRYEAIKDEFLRTGLRSQPLLISSVVKCRPEDTALAVDYADSFRRLGFEVEAFGADSLLLRTAPEGLEPQQASELFRALLEELRDTDADEIAVRDPSRLSPKLERVLATSACHGSVRAGQPLSKQQVEALALQMDGTDSALNCPHGRPASVRLKFSQIEGLFKR